jgi:hypothetical protein
MININEIKEALQSTITAIVEMPVIFANQNAPRPDSDYITILLSTVVDNGIEFFSKADSVTGEITKIINKDLSFSIQCISENGMQILENLKTEITKQVYLDMLYNCNVIFVNANDVNDTTVLLESHYMETRAGIDMFFRSWTEDTEETGIIEEITGTGVIKDIAGNEHIIDLSVDAT